MLFSLEDVKFGGDGLVPVIVQECFQVRYS